MGGKGRDKLCKGREKEKRETTEERRRRRRGEGGVEQERRGNPSKFSPKILFTQNKVWLVPHLAKMYPNLTLTKDLFESILLGKLFF